MKEQKHISLLEKHIKTELDNYKAPYDAKSWETLKTKLPKSSYTKWYWVAATIISILSISAYLLNNNKSQTLTSKTTNTLSLNKIQKVTPIAGKENIIKKNKTINENTLKRVSAPTIPQEKESKNQKLIVKKENNNIVEDEKNDSSFIPKTLITEKINNPITNWDLADINIQEQALCSSSPIYFSIINLPENAKVTWDFGDDNTTTSYNAQHIYKKEGNYKIQLTIFNAKKKITLYKNISINKSPTASFYYKQEKNEIILNNTSENATNTQWFINGKTISVDSLDKAFKYTGEYELQLVAKNTKNCSDSYKEIVHYKKDFKVYAPTAFVPNNDGVNDKYMVKYEFLENYTYNFQIFNNLGVLIFESSRPTAKWNGKIGNNISPKGKYLWKLTITSPLNTTEQYNGYFILIR